jgi:hypothetical protein
MSSCISHSNVAESIMPNIFCGMLCYGGEIEL